MTEEELKTEKEIVRFHTKLLGNVIEIVKLNKEHLDKQKREGLLYYSEHFHQGALMFADVIIHQLNEEIKRIKKELKQELNKQKENIKERE